MARCNRSAGGRPTPVRAGTKSHAADFARIALPARRAAPDASPDERHVARSRRSRAVETLHGQAWRPAVDGLITAHSLHCSIHASYSMLQYRYLETHVQRGRWG